MKKLYFILLLFIQIPSLLVAQVAKTFILNINKEDFSLTVDDKVQNFLTSTKWNSYFKGDTLQPALPYITVNFLISPEKIYQSFTYQTSRSLYSQDIILAPNPQILTTNQTYVNPKSTSSLASYLPGIYPSTNVKYTGTNEMDGYKFLSFEVCPFVYNASTKRLDILTQIKFSITFSSSILTSYTERKGVMDEAVKHMIQNSDEMGILYPATTSQLLNVNKRVEYLIIASPGTYSIFSPFITWKRKKGIPAQILTTDQIYSKYAGATNQLKIKRCIQDYYLNHNLKYVLLGGDDTEVPVQGCYGNVQGTIDNTIPTDLFYACFDKSFDWNANGNKLIGEVADNIDMAPEVYISRLPVRKSKMTYQDFNEFISQFKYIDLYGPSSSTSNNILLSGIRLWSMWDKISDAQHKSEKMYHEYMEPNVKRSAFYDSGSNISVSPVNLNPSSLVSAIKSKQYTHLHMTTHGNQTKWGLVRGYFDTNIVAQFTKYVLHPSLIITTTACITNAFDSGSGYTEDPCLSEAFIRNPHSGVLGYWGSSRFGWDYKGTSALGPSLQYNAKFYEHIFKNSSSTPHNCTFGEAITFAKSFYISQCQTDGAMRWLQFSLNAIGDPELPIYSTEPKILTNASCQWIGNNLMVNTGVIGCRIAATNDSFTYYQIIEDSQYAIFTNLPENVEVWITKPNYRPKNIAVPAKNANIAARTPHTIQNPETENGIAKLYPCHPVTWGESAFIICYVPKEAGSATIHLYDTYGKIIKKEFIPEKEKNTTIIPTGELAPGVYLYTLVIDGRQIDTKRLIIK